MSKQKNHGGSWVFGLFTLLAILIQPSFASAQNGDCSANVTVTQVSRVQDSFGATFKYDIHATSDAAEATVHFKIRRTFNINGSPHSVAEPWSIVLHGGEGDDEGELRESTSPSQIAWSVEEVFCRKKLDPAGNSADSPTGGNSGVASDASTEMDKQFMGNWSGPDHVVYSRPRGQKFDGTYYLEVGQRKGPSTYAGIYRLIGTKTASPGHRFDDDSTTMDVNEEKPVTITIQGSSVVVQAAQEDTLNFSVSDGALVENGVPSASGGRREIRITKQP